MACLYVLPLFLERAYLHSPLCPLLSSNFNSSAHLLCLDLISYFLELLLSFLQRRGGKKRGRKKKKRKIDATFKQGFTVSQCSNWTGKGMQLGDRRTHTDRASAVPTSRNLQPRYRTLRRADGLNWQPLRLFSFTIAHLKHYHTHLFKNTYDQN